MIEEKYSFERYHPRPPTASSFPRLGVRNPIPKLQSLSQKRLKLYGLQIWPIHSQGPSEHKPNIGEKGAWVYPGTAQIFWVPPIISGTRKATNFKFGRCIPSVHACGRDIHWVHPNKSPLKIWEKRERGRIQGLPKFLEYPLLSQDQVNLRTFNIFGSCIHTVHPSKSPLKILGKKECGYMQGLPKFFQNPLLSQERVMLRTSKFVPTFSVSIGTKAHYKFREK